MNGCRVFILCLAVLNGILIETTWKQNRLIQQLSTQHSAAIPCALLFDGDISTYTLYDGKIQCVLMRRNGNGRKVIVERNEF